MGGRERETMHGAGTDVTMLDGGLEARRTLAKQHVCSRAARHAPDTCACRPAPGDQPTRADKCDGRESVRKSDHPARQVRRATWNKALRLCDERIVLFPARLARQSANGR